MCGRYTITASLDLILAHYHISQITFTYAPRYNVAPGQMIPAIISGNNEEKRLGQLKWGFIPSWAKDEKIAYKMINAKSETVLEKPAFRQSLFKKRCIIPADGFYEWKSVGNGKQPMRFVLNSRGLFSMAGLYDTWVSADGVKVHTCTILTTQANDLVRGIHDRMPCILTSEQAAVWLNRNEQDPLRLLSLLQPFPSETMTVYPVSNRVGNVKHDDPDCILPVAT
jgi:putative SOS response-associated peptidase YedK